MPVFWLGSEEKEQQALRGRKMQGCKHREKVTTILYAESVLVLPTLLML